MKACFKKMLALMLALMMLPLSALAATKTEFEITASVYPEGWAEETRFLRDIAQALKTISFTGTVLTNDQRLKFFGYPFSLEASMQMNGRSIINAAAHGTPRFFNLTSNLLGDVQFYMSMDNYYPFMAKPYYFMGIDTPYVALLTYPDGFITAWEPVWDILTEIESAARQNGGTLSSEAITAYAAEMAVIVDQWDPLFRWISAAMIKNGGTFDFIWSMEELGDWVGEITKENGLTITDKENTTCWILGGQTVFTHTQAENGFTWQVNFPDKKDYKANMAFSWLEGTQGGSMDFHINICEGETLLLDGTLTASALPCAGCNSAQAEICIDLAGSLYPEGTHRFLLDWARETQGENTLWHIALSLLNNSTSQKMLTVAGEFALSPYDQPFETGYTGDDYDILCMNDSMLSEVLSRIKKPLVQAVIPLVLELPRGILNELYTLADQYGLINMLQEGTSFGGESSQEDY